MICIVCSPDPITCYKCKDLAENTTCANPVPMSRDPEEEYEPWVTMGPDLPTISCKRGACVKWTYYQNSEYKNTNTSRLQPRSQSTMALDLTSPNPGNLPLVLGNYGS